MDLKSKYDLLQVLLKMKKIFIQIRKKTAVTVSVSLLLK
jgi:hypothetical protein